MPQSILFTSQRKQPKKKYLTIRVSLKWSFFGQGMKNEIRGSEISGREDVSWQVCIYPGIQRCGVRPSKAGGFVCHPTLSRLSSPSPAELSQGCFSFPKLFLKCHEVLGVQEPIPQCCRAYINARYYVNRDHRGKIYRKPTPFSVLGDRMCPTCKIYRLSHNKSTMLLTNIIVIMTIFIIITIIRAGW